MHTKLLSENMKRRIAHERRGGRREDNTKMDRNEIGCEGECSGLNWLGTGSRGYPL